MGMESDDDKFNRIKEWVKGWSSGDVAVSDITSNPDGSNRHVDVTFNIGDYGGVTGVMMRDLIRIVDIDFKILIGDEKVIIRMWFV